MERPRLSRSRQVVGLILAVGAALLLIWGDGWITSAGAVGLGVLGLASIASGARAWGSTPG